MDYKEENNTKMSARPRHNWYVLKSYVDKKERNKTKKSAHPRHHLYVLKCHRHFTKSYRSSLTFVMDDQLFQELLPFVFISFSGLSLVMFSDIRIKNGSKLPCEELQINF